MTEDPWQDPTAKKWIKQVLDDMVPKLEESALVCSLVPNDREGDVKFWVELGASIMMRKPIIVIAFDDKEIPERLRMIADEVVVCPEGVSPESSEEVAQAISRVIGRLPSE